MKKNLLFAVALVAGCIQAATIVSKSTGSVVEVGPIEGNATPTVRAAVARLRNGDTLRFSHYNIDNEYAWYLPWLVEYNGMPFRCYSIALSRWVSNCIPEKFYGKECFDNAHFLLQVANYLWLKHSNGNF